MKKILATVLAFVLVIALTVAGTVAFLTDKTDDVVNTFTVGDIGELSLVETEGTLDSTTGERSFLIVPGVDIDKDPTVSYEAEDDDLPVYVFVKIAGDGWTQDGSSYSIDTDSAEPALSFTVDSGWTALSGVSGVFYQALAKGTDLDSASVIKDDTITVSEDILLEELEDLADASELTFTAYAIQQAGFETNVSGAWTAVSA